MTDRADQIPKTADVAEEAGWVSRAQKGDLAAFGELVARYQDRVFNACLRMAGNREDAEDLTQEAFVRAFRAIDRFDGRARFYTWVFRIGMNLAISAKRGSKRKATYSLEAAGRGQDDRADGSLRERLAGDGPGPQDAASSHEQQEMVLAALADLEETQRAIIVLKDIESLDYQEIADVLEVAVGTVKSRLHRARMALREKLRPMFENG